MSKEQLRIGVIGAGGIARSVHLPSLSEMPDVKVVALCDLVEERAKDLARRHGIGKTYVSYHEMLAAEKPDAVFALVEPGNLFHVVWHCLDAGLPCFMEKPPGITSFQARSLAAKAAEKGRILQVGFNRRHIPLVRRVLETVREKTRITQVEGCFIKFGDAAFDRGSLSAFVSDSIHAVDLVRWMAGGGTVEAAALVAARYDDSVENAWNGVMRFDNGVTGRIQTNYRTGGRVHRFAVHGPGVSAYIDLGFGATSCEAVILSHQGEKRYSIASAGAADETTVRIDGMELAGSREFHRYYGFYQEDRHFIDCVREGRRPDPDIEEGVKSIELVEKLLASRI